MRTAIAFAVSFVNKAAVDLFQFVSPKRPKPYLARFSGTNIKDTFDFAFVTKYFRAMRCYAMRWVVFQGRLQL
jgi:hypothetical protein